MVCRVCGSDELELYYTQGDDQQFKFKRCDECGMVNYDLSNGLNQEKYGRVYIDPYDEDDKVNIAQTITYRFITKHLDKPGSVLDIGCGNGRLLYLLQKAGWQPHGLELSPLLAESIEKKLGIDVDIANFLEDGYTDQKYDLVVLRHVLEHLPEPVLAMKQINSALKENGHAVLEFPNIKALDLKVKRLLQKAGIHDRTYGKGYVPGHCNEYNKDSFTFLAEKAGFEVVVWETYSYKPVKNFFYNLIPIGNKARTIIRKKSNIK